MIRQAQSDDISPHPARRYRLRAQRVPVPRLRVVDLLQDADLADWHGHIAERLLDCGLLPASLAAGGDCYGCKNLIQRLALLAASESMVTLPSADETDRAVPTPCSLTRRLRILNLRLSSDEHSIARLLFGHVDRHLSTGDVACLLGLRNAPVTDRRVEAILQALVEKQVIQRLPVHDGPTFYDIDTRPHLHIYDRDSNTLRDADVHGIVESESIAALFVDAKMTVSLHTDAANDHT